MHRLQELENQNLLKYILQHSRYYTTIDDIVERYHKTMHRIKTDKKALAFLNKVEYSESNTILVFLLDSVIIQYNAYAALNQRITFILYFNDTVKIFDANKKPNAPIYQNVAPFNNASQIYQWYKL